MLQVNAHIIVQCYRKMINKCIVQKPTFKIFLLTHNMNVLYCHLESLCTSWSLCDILNETQCRDWRLIFIKILLLLPDYFEHSLLFSFFIIPLMCVSLEQFVIALLTLLQLNHRCWRYDLNDAVLHCIQLFNLKTSVTLKWKTVRNISSF